MSDLSALAADQLAESVEQYLPPSDNWARARLAELQTRANQRAALSMERDVDQGEIRLLVKALEAAEKERDDALGRAAVQFKRATKAAASGRAAEKERDEYKRAHEVAAAFANDKLIPRAVAAEQRAVQAEQERDNYKDKLEGWVDRALALDVRVGEAEACAEKLVTAEKRKKALAWLEELADAVGVLGRADYRLPEYDKAVRRVLALVKAGYVANARAALTTHPEGKP